MNRLTIWTDQSSIFTVAIRSLLLRSQILIWAPFLADYGVYAMSELQDVPAEQQTTDAPVTPEAAVTEAHTALEEGYIPPPIEADTAKMVSDGTLPGLTIDFSGAGDSGASEGHNEGAKAAGDKGTTTKNPDGSEVTVDDQNRVIAAVDASGQRTSFKYEGDNKDPNQVFVQDKGDLKPTAYTRGEDGVYRDTMGNEFGSDIKFGKDGSFSYVNPDNNRVVEKSDGTQVVYSGDDFYLSKPIQITGADGKVTDYSYGKDGEINAVRSYGSAMIKTENGWVDENGKKLDIERISVDVYGKTHIQKTDDSVVTLDEDGKVISTKQANKGFGSFVWDEGDERKFAYSEFGQVIGITETVDGKTKHYTKDNASGKWVDENGKDTGMRDVKIEKDGTYSYTNQRGERVSINTDGTIAVGKKLN